MQGWWPTALPWIVLVALLSAPVVWGYLDKEPGSPSQLRYRFRSLNNEDGRRSTSKLTAFVWIIAVAAAAAFLLTKVALDAALTLAAVGLEELNEQYLVLMGVPVLTLIASKGIVQAKTQAGSLQNPAANRSPGFKEGGFASDEKGKVDLIDLQYLLFNGVLLVFFSTNVLAQTSIPDLPPTLVGLSSAAAAAYVAGKAVAANPPTIGAATHTTNAAGDNLVVIRGTNLLKPLEDDLTQYVSISHLETRRVEWRNDGTIISAVVSGPPPAGTEVSITTASGACVSCAVS